MYLFFSVIVFFGSCSLRNQIEVPQNTYLIHARNAINVFKEILEQNEPTTYSSKREIVNLLQSAHTNGESEEIKTKHVENIKRNFNY